MRTTGDKTMKIIRKHVLVAIITNAVLLLGIHATEAEQASSPLSSAQIIEILSSPDRTAADRTNDSRRKPEQMLGFIGIRPGIVALDLSAGIDVNDACVAVEHELIAFDDRFHQMLDANHGRNFERSRQDRRMRGDAAGLERDTGEVFIGK